MVAAIGKGGKDGAGVPVPLKVGGCRLLFPCPSLGGCRRSTFPMPIPMPTILGVAAVLFPCPIKKGVTPRGGICIENVKRMMGSAAQLVGLFGSFEYNLPTYWSDNDIFIELRNQCLKGQAHHVMLYGLAARLKSSPDWTEIKVATAISTIQGKYQSQDIDVHLCKGEARRDTALQGTRAVKTLVGGL